MLSMSGGSKKNVMQDAFLLSKSHNQSAGRIERVGDVTLDLHTFSKQDPKRRALEKVRRT